MDPLQEGEDVDAYITQFERIATMHRWKQTSWAAKLVSLLRGRVRDAVMRLSAEVIAEYDQVKAAVLRYFRLDAEAYCKKFRSMRKEVEETFPQFLDRLRNCLTRWCAAAKCDEDDASQVKDLFLKEQLYSVLNPDMVAEVRKAQPKCAEEMAKEAANIAAAHRARREAEQNKREARTARQGSSNPETPRTEVRPRQTQELVGNVSKDKRIASQEPGSAPRPRPTCYACGEVGHIAKHCRNTKRVARVQAQEPAEPRREVPALCVPCAQKEYTPRCVVEVDGQPAEGLRDTGAGQIVVAKKLVHSSAYTGRTQSIILAESRCRTTVPVAVVHIVCPFVCGEVEALVMEKPVEDVLIGNYTKRPNTQTWERIPVYAVTPCAAVQTRAQVRDQRRTIPLKVQGIDIGVSTDEMAARQETDSTLAGIRQEVGKPAVGGKDKVWFIRKNGVIVRKFDNGKSVATQICLPKDLRQGVMALAHDTPMAGHLRTKRTQERIRPHFYWPGMLSEVRRYCLSCVRCQKTTDKGRNPRAPLERMPIVEVPFERVAVDIIGPILPRAKSGAKYVLVMVDYATRYPEAMALRDIATETVAEALFTMWTRMGIPKEILTDRGTQFTSNMMAEVRQLLGVKGLHTTPYHAQCNGLVERFNGTLKRMLRRLAGERPEEWDRWIPALLFAYREVPQESTGFTPFELVYGRTVRGPLQLLKEVWTHPEAPEAQTAAEYVVNLRNKIADTCAIAQKAAERAGRKHKTYFDRRAKVRDFLVGSRVLMLRPTKANKLELEWRGPYVVKERVGRTDYRIDVQGKEKILHANLLKQFVERQESNKAATTVAAVVTEEAEEAFQELKRQFIKPPVCILPNHDKRFYLRTDASDRGLGALLLQERDDLLRPVACASRKLNAAEVNYPIVEKECLAVIWGVQKFEPYLYGRKFTIQTDHSPLRHLESMKSTSGRLTRWALQLQPFCYEVQVIPGKDNLGADYLSRL